MKITHWIIRLLSECKYHLGESAKSIAAFTEVEKMLIDIGEKYVELHRLYQT